MAASAYFNREVSQGRRYFLRKCYSWEYLNVKIPHSKLFQGECLFPEGSTYSLIYFLVNHYWGKLFSEEYILMNGQTGSRRPVSNIKVLSLLKLLESNLWNHGYICRYLLIMKKNFFPTFFKVCKSFEISSLKISEHVLNLISWLIYRSFLFDKKSVQKEYLKENFQCILLLKVCKLKA